MLHDARQQEGAVVEPGSLTAVAPRRGVATRQSVVRFMALERQHAEIESDLRAAFTRVVNGNAFILGAEVDRFEAEFAEYCGAAHCVGVSSGTSALSLMLRASGIGPGDEVIVPAHTFIASALAVAHVGAVPVLCDVLDGTGLIDANAARALVGPRTAAILAVHLYGQACDMDAIDAVARPHGLLMLEDAAQAHGAWYRGRRVGTLGAAAAFSFYPGKNLGALGDGGAICTSDENLAQRLRRLRNLGQERKGEHLEIGYNERLDGLQAAFLRVKLSYLAGWNLARR
jgi:dTDP-3-amino-3,4,6-trideoxy-alpha-D-glucose transaminase